MNNALYEELEKLIRGLKPGFFGVVEVGVQNGHPNQVRVTETFKLSNRATRGTNDDSCRQ
jgi:hypothetical protein